MLYEELQFDRKRDEPRLGHDPILRFKMEMLTVTTIVVKRP